MAARAAPRRAGEALDSRLRGPPATEPEPAILTGHHRGSIPPAYRLEQVATHLAAKGDHRMVVTFVEKWLEVGEPTVPARLAQARSLLELRMVDKALMRVKDLAEGAPPNVDALVITGEGQLLRGWNREARRTAERGIGLAAHHPGFRAMLERASEAITHPDEEAVEPEGTPVPELVRVAEQFMAQAAFVRARTLLERARRKVPEHRWAKDLLWAMDGEYTRGTASLADLCDGLGPDHATLPEPAADEPEHTEAGRHQDSDTGGNRNAFPALFRNMNKANPEEATDAEVTAVSAMAGHQELAEPPDQEHTDPHGDDTQIVRVVQKTRPAAPVPDARDKDVPVNLASLRSGPAAGKAAPTDYATGGDDEDDALVVHTRRDDSTDGSTRGEAGGLTEELALEQAAKSSKGAVEDAGWATPLAGAPRTAGPAGPVPHRRVDAAAAGMAAGAPPSPGAPKKGLVDRAPAPTPVPTTRGTRPAASNAGITWWVMAVVGLLAFGAVVFSLLVIVLAVKG